MRQDLRDAVHGMTDKNVGHSVRACRNEALGDQTFVGEDGIKANLLFKQWESTPCHGMSSMSETIGAPLRSFSSSGPRIIKENRPGILIQVNVQLGAGVNNAKLLDQCRYTGMVVKAARGTHGERGIQAT